MILNVKITNNSTVWPSLFGLLILLFAIQFSSTTSGVLDDLRKRLEWLAYDLRMELLFEEKKPDPRVVIIDIDERSLQQEGHWPWSRQKIAQLTTNLFEAGAAVIGYDIVFPETAPNPALRVLDKLTLNKENTPYLENVLAHLTILMDGDLHLVNAVSDLPVVLGFVFEYRKGEPSGILPPNPIAPLNPRLEKLQIHQFPTFTGNIEQLQIPIKHAGFFNTDPDNDGVIRRSPLLAIYQDNVYASLALEMVHQYFGAPGLEFLIEENGDSLVLEGISFPPGLLSIPTNNSGEVFIPYRGKDGSYLYISATDVLSGKFDKSTVRDALILIGTSAAGLFDLRATPMDKVFPGVEIHANLISAILDESFPIRTLWIEGIDFAILIVSGLLFALLFPHLRPIWLLSVWLTASIGYIVLNFWLWQVHHLVTSLAVPLILLLSLTLLNMTWGYLRETRSRARLSSMFGQYVPAELVEEMNRNPDSHFGFEGESRDMTVLFCDIRNFTTLSEALSANDLKHLLNFFFTPMTKIIFDNRGTVDKYVGDMIMAFWSAPIKDPDHRSQGILSALNMLRAIKDMESDLKERNWPLLRMGVGLNSGMMNVGDMGSTYRRAYTVLGDSVNLASRCEGLTKFYYVDLIVGENTMLGQRNKFLYRLLDRVQVKGKLASVEIFEPICLAEGASEAMIQATKTHNKAIKAYFSRQWDETIAAFTSLHGKFATDDYYHMMQKRIELLRLQNLPDDWGGSFSHTSK